ncbi:MAG: alpha/beta hydrolase [Candidatus Obscuribacterales bacterium]|nr:alpha/beta hydrolase [Candidatus Obscuribacterales bacterium]
MITANHKIPGLVIKDHEFQVPLDHEKPEQRQISVFAREVAALEYAEKQMPWMLFLNGGPGFACSRPESRSGWLARALQEYRVLLLDQRGTGLSTPVTHQTLSALKDAQAQAEYLSHFRADNIVRDAEFIRKELVGEKWTVLGQSFGGFCILTYLSFAPEGLQAALITGGIPPIGQKVDDVYRATYKRVLEQNRLYFERYPGDAEKLKRIYEYVETNNVCTPAGERLSVRRLQQLGIHLGFTGGFERLHYLIESAFVSTGSGTDISYIFTKSADAMLEFNTNPIYVLLHEAIYCEGQASDWSAERVRSEFPQFNPETNSPPLFTGEMVYPWMLDEYSCLAKIKDAAQIVAKHRDWPRLYNLEQLQQNEVPTAAAVYLDDMYVEWDYSQQLARQIPKLRLWATNEYMHSGLRDDGERIIDRLLAMVNGAI